MAQTPAGTADPARVRQYVDILAFCAHECAETRGGPHDVFLWNARRLSEALLYALAEGTEFAAQAKPLQGRPMDHAELTRKLMSQGRVPSQLGGFFDILRSCGNVGAHSQGPDVVADTATLDACRRAIIAVVRWFYYDSALAEPMPAAVSDALRDLETEQARTPRPHRTEMELRKLRREVEHLKSQLSPELSMIGADGGEIPGPQRRRAARLRLALFLGVLLTGLCVGWLAGTWARLGDGGQAAAPAAEAVRATPQPAPAAPPTAAPGPTIEPATDLPGEGSAVAATAGQRGQAEPAAAEATPAQDQAERGAVEAVLEIPASPEPAAPEGELAGAPGDRAVAGAACPEGALAIAARQLALAQGPNPRPNWPQPAPTPPPAKVGEFCIDRDAVSSGTFAAWLQTGGVDERATQLRRRGNAALAGAEKLPANQVTWADAASFCSSRSGSLPSALQWEAALRHKPAPRLAPATGEWALDTFPPAAFGYSAARPSSEHLYFKEHLGGRPSSRKPLLSWQRGKAVRNGAAAVTFRCAYPR